MLAGRALREILFSRLCGELGPATEWTNAKIFYGQNNSVVVVFAGDRNQYVCLDSGERGTEEWWLLRTLVVVVDLAI